MGHPKVRVVAGILAWTWLAAPCLAADAEQCRPLRERRDGLGEQAMQEEITLARTMRERICPALSRAAEEANANASAGASAGAGAGAGANAGTGAGAGAGGGPTDQNFALIDYGALIDCRRRAEVLLERTHSMLYRNRLQFTFFTAAGAALARQADELARQMEAAGCPPGR